MKLRETIDLYSQKHHTPPCKSPHTSGIPLLESLLLLSRVPSQLPTNTIDPILAPASFCLNRGEWISARADSHIVAGAQLYSLSPVKTGPRGRPGIVGDANSQNDGVGQNDWSEGQRVSADGCNEHDGILRVAQGATGSEIVSRRARRCRYTNAICEHRSKVLVVSKDFRI